MDKAKKKRIIKYVTWVSMVAFVAVLALMPLLANANQEDTGLQASILSGTVKSGTITTSLYGGGTLTSEGAVEITLPYGVKITEFLVSNGDLVSEGDPLAAVDKVSLMSAITAVQDTMDYLVEEMADIRNQQNTTRITTQVTGLVKQVFAEPGDSVQDVMLEHGALAVISLDEMMAVRLECNTLLATGDNVFVAFEDGTEVTGRVESNMDGILVVTVEDEGYAVDETVAVTSEAGENIGSGNLYVHNAWKAVAYAGTVDSVNVKPESKTYPGQTLLSLKDSEFNVQLESLASQHQKYEALMLELFRLYQADAILAPCDGMVSGVDKDSIHLLSGFELDLLANAPGLDPDILVENYVGQLSGMLGSYWMVNMNPQPQSIADYKTELELVDVTAENMSASAPMEAVTVYILEDGEWKITTAKEGDILLFAMSQEGFVWAIHLGSADVTPTDPTMPPEGEEETLPPADGELPTLPEFPEDSEGDSETDGEQEESVPGLPSFGIPSTGIPSMGGSFGSMMGGFFGGGAVQEEEYQLYSLEESVLLNVIPQELMTLSIRLDERDIAKIRLGMKAEVTVPALRNQVFPAVITAIGDTGTNYGGSSKFNVELTLEAQEQMLAGMSATATIDLFTSDNLLLIPSEALVESGAKTLVYTGYDEKSEELIDPVEVTTGASDGVYTEIISGLSPDDTFWYRYYDTLEIDHGVEEPSFRFG